MQDPAVLVPQDELTIQLLQNSADIQAKGYVPYVLSNDEDGVGARSHIRLTIL